MSEHETIHAALVAALSGLTGVPKTRKATIPTKDGGKYSYEYANIEDVIDHTRPLLAEHGLVVLQPPCATEHGMGVRTLLVHESGETLDVGTLPFRSAGDPQRDGMAITYYRRYALLSALGLAAEDDDGTVTREDHAAPPEPLPDGESVTAAKKRITAAGFDTSAAKALWEQADLPIETVTINGESVRWVSPEAVSVLEGCIIDWLASEGAHDGLDAS